MRVRVGSHEPPSSTVPGPRLRRIFRRRVLLCGAGGTAGGLRGVRSRDLSDRFPDDDGRSGASPPRSLRHGLDFAANQRRCSLPFAWEPWDFACDPRLPGDSGPAGDEFLADPSDAEMSAYRDLEQAQDAAAVSAALSRLVPTGEPPTAGTLAERLSGMRARSSAVLVSEGRETAGVLLRLVNDMKPLLAAAKKVGLDLPELRRLVAEAAAGHEADLSQRVRLVEQVKGTLEAALVERIAESLQRILLDSERRKSATQQVHAAEMTAAEAVALLDTGNYAGAVDRAEKAREILETHVVALPSRLEAASAPSSFVALAGPAFVAVAFVAASSMLLPAVDGFLLANRELNTAAILTLSYGWFGLIMYALMSVYYVMRPASTKPSAMERIARRQ